MSVITLDGLPGYAAFEISQVRYDMTESSDSTGSEAARLLGPPRWRVAARSGDDMTLAAASWWESLFLRLRGRVNHMAVYDPIRTLPRGTIRGLPTLNASAAAGATGIVLAGAIDGNLLVSGGFELDTDLNGAADGWTLYDSGTAGTVTPAAGTAYAGSRGQRVSATALQNAPSSAAGVYQLVTGITPGLAYTLSAYELSATASQIGLAVAWQTSGGVPISSSITSFTANTGAYGRHEATFTAPATAAQVQVFIYMHTNPVLGAAQVNIDNAQFEQAAAATDFKATATLLAGDWLQLGSGVGTSQLVKCVTDAQAHDAGIMSVTIEPPLRTAFAGGTVVTLDKPVAYYKQTSVPQWGYRSGRLQGGFALDGLESWA